MSGIRNGVSGFNNSRQKMMHLKRKELTAIKKAARVLRDPGTTTTSSNLKRSGNVFTYPPRDVNDENDSNAGKFVNLNEKNDNDSTLKNNEGPEKKRVFLYNWRSNSNSRNEDGGDHRSCSEKSRTPSLVLRGVGKCWGGDDDKGEEDDVKPNDEDAGYLLGSTEETSSDARNDGGHGDSKNDNYMSDCRVGSMIFGCRDATEIATPSMRRALAKAKKKPRKSSATHSAGMPRNYRKQQQGKVVLLGMKNVGASSNSIGLGCNESDDQSDDTEDYSVSGNMRRFSAGSPFVSRIRNNKSWSRSSKLLRIGSRGEDSSYTYSTPALSTSSYNRNGVKYPSTVGSWDGSTASFNDCDDDNFDFSGSQGCGIPCYWSKRTPSKHGGGCRSCYSPSLSDTLRRKGSSILCGNQSKYHQSHHPLSGPNKGKTASKSAQGILPLLPRNCEGRGGSSLGTGLSDDELSTNYGELDLEALSRLDGRRWSTSCRSQEGLEIVALNGEGEVESTPDSIRSLSRKYRPVFFDEIIGQKIVVQSLVTAISRGRIAPVYLFHGPRGTGKTSTARIFAAALNCMATDETKPCGYCRECTDFVSGSSRHLMEADGTNKLGIDKIRNSLRNSAKEQSATLTQYNIFIVDECHLLPSKTWLAFLKFLEDPPPQFVFVFITTDLDNVPRTVVSRCQKYLFNKIKDGDIVNRLRKLVAEENLDVESDALDMIASNADGSLRDAETMLDQLSLLGKRITTSLVNELIGVVSDDKLLELLELAMSSDTAETVKKARELLDSGVDPMVLMSQLASLIMDIIAGTYQIVDAKSGDSFSSGRTLTEPIVERFKYALKLLSDAEKQLRVSSDRSTWFTATLLQLGTVPSPDHTLSGSSRRQSSKTTEEDPSSALREGFALKEKKSYTPYVSHKSTSPGYRGSLSVVDGPSSKPKNSRLGNTGSSATSFDDVMFRNMILGKTNSEKLNVIWERCIEKCHSQTLRQLLYSHGKLVSISGVEGASVLVAYIAFGDGGVKSRAERFLSSITNSFEIVLRCNVEIRIILLPDGDGERKVVKNSTCENFDIGSRRSPNSSKGVFNDSKTKLQTHSSYSPARSAIVLSEGNPEISGGREKAQGVPMQRIESIIREHRLETAWLQAAEKSACGSINRARPERNQVLPQPDKNQILPQVGIRQLNHMESTSSVDMSAQQWEDELNHELKVLKINDGTVLRKDQVSERPSRYPMSPSLLHDRSFTHSLSKESLGYESGSGARGCSSIFCWNMAKPENKRNQGKGGALVKSQKSRRFLSLGECCLPKQTGSKSSSR